MEETIEANQNEFRKLQSALDDYLQDEVQRIVSLVVNDLRSRPPHSAFDDVAARHLWDEYCWAVQEGPFDDDLGWNNITLGSLSGAFDDVVRSSIQAQVEKLPKHTLILLSARAMEEDTTSRQEGLIGSIWIDGIVSLARNSIDSRASSRRVTLFGPDRVDEIPYEISGSGLVWDILSERGQATEIVANHCDALLEAGNDLSELSDELIEAFIAVAAEDNQGEVFPFLLERFGDEICEMLRQHDVQYCLETLRSELSRILDD